MITKLDSKNASRLMRGGRSIKATLDRQQADYKATEENLTLLYNCATDWNALREVRETRRRNIRYKNGDQWGDLVTDPDTGKKIREDRLISKNGKIPLKHNFIMQYVRNIHGQRLSNPTQAVVNARASDESDLSDMLTNTIQANHHLNEIATLDANMLEELLMGGLGAVKIGYQFWDEKNRYDARIDLVNTNRLFFSQDFEDPRMDDLHRIGEIHDYSLDELVDNFARSKEDEKMLRQMFFDRRLEGENRSKDNLQSLDFYGLSVVSNKYRIVEVWEKRSRWVLYCHDYLDGSVGIREDLNLRDVEAINAERVALAATAGIPAVEVSLIYTEEIREQYWQVKFLTPAGLCLKETETPYEHQSHPYIFTMMPVVDGAIAPVLTDLIDIQRYINRLIVMIDFIMGASAKGVLMVPEDCIPEGYTIDDFAKAYVKTNGVILIAKNALNKLPQQISANATNIGGWEMLKLQLDLIQQISGLSGAVQGHTAAPGTAASLYAQQTNNSMLNYAIVFERHSLYCSKRDEKLLKVIMQYYDEPRYIDWNGKALSDTAKKYLPEMAEKVVDFNLVTSQSTNTPVYRQLADVMLMDMLKAGLIPLEVFLNNTTFPNVDKLRNDLKNFNEQAKQGQIDAQQMAGLQQQASQNADPRAVGMMGRFVGGGGNSGK